MVSSEFQSSRGDVKGAVTYTKIKLKVPLESYRRNHFHHMLLGQSEDFILKY
jgi:hypothetical protein